MVTEPKGSTLFICKCSVGHYLELVVFTSYLFIILPHSRGFTITVICSFLSLRICHFLSVIAVHTSAVIGMFC
jgi:hypothetical protein